MREICSTYLGFCPSVNIIHAHFIKKKVVEREDKDAFCMFYSVCLTKEHLVQEERVLSNVPGRVIASTS